MWKIILAGTILLLIGVGFFTYLKFAPQNVVIPQKLTQENKAKNITTYLPSWLPGTYAIDRDSFSKQDGQVFGFSATDANRNRLFFSEQPKPKNFDFDRFYKTQVVNPQKLSDVPFPSVYAQAPFGKTFILSIVTNTTWIMITTDAPVDIVMAQRIVQEMKPY